jgi:uncharacterized membrane protein YkvA (DUF1232 family)
MSKLPVSTRLRHGVQRYSPGELAAFGRRLPALVRTFLGLVGDRRVGFLPKVLLVGAFGYVLSPLDFLSDALPFLGQLDDFSLLALACRIFLGLCPPNVVAEHRSKNEPVPAAVPVDARARLG